MATVIDSLVVELGLDASKFGSSANQANKSMDGVTKGAKRTAASVDGASNSLIKGAAAFGAFFGAALTISGLNAFVDKVTKMNTELDRTSKNLGTSAQSLKEWQNTAELMGGTAEGVTSTMKSFSKAQTEMSVTGQTGMLPYMRALGVSMFDAQGKARPLGDMLLDLADRFKGMDRTQANNFGQMMGIDQATMNMLLEGRGAVQDMLETQKKMRKPSDDEVKASVELTKARAKLNQQLEGLEVVLVGAVTPALIFLTKAAEGFVGFLTENEQAVKAVFLGTSAVIGTMLIPTLWSAAAAAFALASPFLLVGAAVALAGVAVGLLLDDYITFTKGGKSVTGSFTAHFKERWRDAGQSFKRILEDFKAYWGDSVEFFKSGWRFIVAIFTGGSDEIRQAGEALAEAFVKPFIRGFELIKDTYNTAKNFVTGKDKASEPAKPVETSAQKTERVTQEAKAIVQASGAGKAVGDTGVAITNMGSGVLDYGGGLYKNGKLKLSSQDVEDIVKVASTEVSARLKGVDLERQTAGVVDTILNRVALNGGNVRKVVNTYGAFSKINSALKDKNGNPDDYGSVQAMPISAVNRKSAAAALAHLKARAAGRGSIVDGNVNYANPNFLQQSSAATKKWVAEVYSQARQTGQIFGAGNEIHVHGTPTGQKRAPRFDVEIPQAAQQATNFVSQSTNAQRLASTTNNSSSKHVEVAIHGMTVNTSANSLHGVAKAGFDASTRRMMIANSDVAMV